MRLFKDNEKVVIKIKFHDGLVREIYRTKVPDSTGKAWTFNGDPDNITIGGSILNEFDWKGKDYKYHFWIRDHKLVNCGDADKVELVHLEYKTW